MSGHMSYFTSPAQPRSERRFMRPQPEESVSLWSRNGRVRRSRDES
jgi:hypothetical protein